MTTAKRVTSKPRKAKPTAPKAKPANFDSLLEWLSDYCDKPRMEKVTAMLKCTRHQLFCDVSEERVVGVIRSQKSTRIFYACKLEPDGTFGCCDHELQACMGQLGNKPCKHLMLLLLGLVRAEKIKLEQAVEWVSNIKNNKRKPVVDNMLMVETLMKYRGAESGAVDWRPLETIPEDYYSL